MSIRIVTDSTADLPEEVAAEYGIVVVPAYVNIGEESYLDGIELSREDFYNGLPSYRDHPTTAAPAPGAFTEAYSKLIEEGAKDILPLAGRVVIFESQLLEHEVKVVKASERFSITGWLKTR